MSQVRKLQAGGSITIDGNRYEATPELIQALSSHLRGYGDTATPLAGITNALQNGRNLVYDSIGNTITGMQDSDWVGVGDHDLKRRAVGDSDFRKGVQSFFNTDAHRFRKALSLLSGFRYNTENKPDESTNLTDIFGNKTWYKWGEDGKLLNNAAENIGINSRLDNITNFLADEEAGKKKYRLGSEYSPERMSALRTLYKQDPKKWDAIIAQIKQHASQGPDALKEDELAFLKNFNIYNDDTLDGTAKISSAERTKWHDAGFGDDVIDKLWGRASLDDDGTLSLNEGASWGWDLHPALTNQNLWFNDNFYNSKYASDGRMNPFKGLTLYNNRLYGANNKNLRNLLNVSGGWNDLMKSGNWDAADEIIRGRYTEDALVNPGTVKDDDYSTFFEGKNYLFNNVTGLKKLANMPNGSQLVQYVDLDSDDYSGGYRQYGYKYALLDSRGNLLKDANGNDLDNIDPSLISTITKGKSVGDLNTYKRVMNPTNTDYNNMYYEDLTDSKGKETGFRIYSPIGDGNNVIVHMPEIYAANAENKDLKLPKDLAQAIFAKGGIWNSVLKDAQSQKNFMKMLSQLVNNSKDWKQSILGTSLGFIFPGIGQMADNIINRNKVSNRQGLKMLKQYGFSDEEAQQIQALLMKYVSDGSKKEQQEKYLTDSLKNGGVIKAQAGAIVGGGTSSRGTSEKRVSVTATNPKNSAGVIGDSKNWTDADTADLMALVGDIGSLGLAFVPGANVASAGVGATSSTARLKADLERGTKGAGWNYLLNLGMDAATLLPIMGGAAKAGKVARVIKTALPTIIKAASVYGLGSAFVNTAKKIANGEKFTVRDVSTLINGLTAGVGLAKSGGFGRSTTKGAKITEGIELAGKKGTNADLTGKKIELTGDEVASIAKLEQAKQEGALNKLLVDKVKAATGNSSLSDADALSAVDRTRFDKEVRNLKPGKGFGKKDLTFDLGATTKGGDRVLVEANGKWFHDWWHGVNGRQVAYNKQLTEGPLEPVTVKRTATTTPKMGDYLPKSVKFKGKTIKLTSADVQTIRSGKKSLPTILKEKNLKLDEKDLFDLANKFRAIPDRHNWTTNTTVEMDGAIPSWYRRRISSTNTTSTLPYGKFVPKNIPNTTSTRTRVYDINQGVALPQWIRIFTDANRQLNQNTQPTTPPFIPMFQKKGGKIVKAWGGALLDAAILALGNYNQPPIDDEGNVRTGVLDAMKQQQLADKAKNPPEESNSSTRIFGGNNVDTTGYFDPVPLINTISGAFALGDVKKSLDRAEAIPAFTQSSLLENSRRFVSSGLPEKIRKTGDALLSGKNSYSDPLLNEALNLQRQQARLGKYQEADTQLSSEWAERLRENDELLRNLRLQNYQIAVGNSKAEWDKKMRDLQYENAALANRRDIIDKMVYSNTQYLDNALKTRQQLVAERELAPERVKLETDYKNEINAWKTKWAGEEDSAEALAHLARIRNDYTSAINNYKLKVANYQQPFGFTVKQKSGGKILKDGKESKVTYSRDPYPELLLLNSKNAARFVEKLNDAAIKLILQTKPTHVS